MSDTNTQKHLSKRVPYFHRPGTKTLLKINKLQISSEKKELFY